MRACFLTGLLCIGAPGFGQSLLEQGKQALVNLDSEAAFRILKPLADAGDTDAQESMGDLCYFQGFPRATTKTANHDDSCPNTQAVGWYRLAAQKGNPKAQCNLGSLLSFDGEKNDSEAFKWMLKSAEQGYPDCMCDVGVFYRGGRGTNQSYNEAFKWFNVAAEKTNSCQYELGQSYAFGQGVETDYRAATAILRKEAEKPVAFYQANAALLLGIVYEKGGHGIGQDYVEAANWYMKVIDP